MRLGPILEAIVDGKYYWMPFNVIKSLTVEEPVDLRDSVWMPAGIKLLNGGDIVALIPTRYAGTLSTNENKLKLSRETNWEDIGNGTYIGTGQRIFATDTGDVSLMDLRTLNMHSSSSESIENDG
jgi:type VI secretion system protein ImpE